ncbi:DUF7689 domain-containing protein [Roseovarius sp. Pro17]|uniref:DUF7689 domain-containing protein n=1 Tax=Roseovarius sp. Pro17 TaxID=3108175 RepID=UPI002D78B29D|nr:hypothetical protein [Roseovarius sp. Pro17]
MITKGNPHTAMLVGIFPNIQPSALITSPQTEVYNCIAYAAGDMTRWWWPDAMGMCYWPPGAMRLSTLPAFQIAYETLGFQLCADDSFVEGVEKIAIFHLHNEPTHAAKLIDQGTWSSKLGKSYDISHSKTCLDDISANGYGEIAYFMQRVK